MLASHAHFSSIAPRYTGLRTTDMAPIEFVAQKLKDLPLVHAADVGCGSGRYDEALLRQMHDRLRLICIDENEAMLRELQNDLRLFSTTVQVARARARALPLPAQVLDCIFTFNAVHHFRMRAFLREAERILKLSGRLFIYTRTRSQNRRNIWGKYFPGFHERENRLFELEELLDLTAETSGLGVEALSLFKYARASSLRRLAKQARHRHYSTFDMYPPQEFRTALGEFQTRLRNEFEDPETLTWTDENLMLVLRRS